MVTEYFEVTAMKNGRLSEDSVTYQLIELVMKKMSAWPIARYKSRYLSRDNFFHWLDQKLWEKTAVGPMPKISTLENIFDWDIRAISEHPWRYWVSDTFLTILKNLWYWPYDKLIGAKGYYRMRFVEKTHRVETGLAAGEWHSPQEKMNAAIWNVFVDWVECSCASSTEFSRACKEGIDYPSRIFGQYRSSADGVEYLKWEAALTDAQDWQIQRGIEALELYTYWKDEYLPLQAELAIQQQQSNIQNEFDLANNKLERLLRTKHMFEEDHIDDNGDFDIGLNRFLESKKRHQAMTMRVVQLSEHLDD
jgi:hypothetical protein